MRITISSQPKLLGIVRSVVKYCAQEAGFASGDAESLVMAVDEAATNVLRHGYKDRRDARLALEVLTFSDRLEFILEDTAAKVREADVQPRPLEEVRPGGLGMHLINKFMDSCSYDDSFRGGNRLRMTKRLPRKASDESSSPKQG